MWMPHPIVYFGKAISATERWLNKGGALLEKGALAAIILIATTYALFFLGHKAIQPLSGYIQVPIIALFVFFGLANRTLISEVQNVFTALNEDISKGRVALSRIVGRDTTNLNEQQIRKAALETLSENLSDGVVAPLFYYALGGVPAMMTYKMVNTLDSMWGYKNDRYLLFGRVAARIDDVANFIPARLTALLMALVVGRKEALSYVHRYGRKHTSPNSGYPEAALAGILECQFGGGSYYGGIFVSKPAIGHSDRLLTYNDMLVAVTVNHRVTFVMIIAISLISIWL